MMEEAIRQVQATGLACYGFFSRAGFEGEGTPRADAVLYGLEDLYA